MIIVCIVELFVYSSSPSFPAMSNSEIRSTKVAFSAMSGLFCKHSQTDEFLDLYNPWIDVNYSPRFGELEAKPINSAFLAQSFSSKVTNFTISGILDCHSWYSFLE